MRRARNQIDEPLIYIGLTGLSRTGKSTVAMRLCKIGESLDFLVFRYSLSDEIRQEWQLRHAHADESRANSSQAKEMTRLELIKLGDEGRQAEGEGCWAKRVITRIQGEVGSSHSQPVLVIVDSIRHPGEVHQLRNQWGDRFVLLALRAEEEKRDARGIQRGREGEQNGTPEHVEQADRTIGIEDCVALASWTIDNNGSIADLERECAKFSEQFIVPLLAGRKLPLV